MHAGFPAEMSEYFNLRWVNAKIWLLDLPVRSTRVDMFEWHLHCPFWATHPPDKLFDLCPREVIDHPGRYPDRYGKVLAVDTSFAVETMYFDSLLVILDGIHRLANHIFANTYEINYRIVPREDFRLIERKEA